MSTFDRHSPVTLYHQLALALKDHIREELSIGDKLPSIRTLLKTYPVSLPVVRQALAELKTDGVIDIHHGKGCIVTSIPQARDELKRRIFVVLNARGIQATFFFKVLMCVQQQANTIPVEILDTENFPHHVFSQAYHGQYGVIVCGGLTSPIVKTLSQMPHPCLVIGDDIKGQPALENPNRIVNDDETGGYLAATHLCEQGCERFLIVIRDKEQEFAKRRIKGYLKGLEEHGHRAEIIECGEHVAQHVSAFFEHWPRPDGTVGILSTTDRIAMGVIEAARKHQLAIPRDLRLTGFDNDYFSQELLPPLTTVAINLEEMGRLCNRLIHEAWNEQPIPRHTVVPVSLIKRESS